MLDRKKAVQALRTARWVRDQDAQTIFKVLDGLSDHTRAVGGAVRDTLLGRYSIRTDLDLATELSPDEVIERAKDAGLSYYPTGIKHGTVTVRCGQTNVEVTTLREDVSTDGRHAKVAFGKDWIADARRRDFTINALYSSMNGVLFDPLDALTDLLEQRVVFIGDPDQRIAEDYLRVYRFFRFTAGYAGEKCEPESLAACARASDKLGQLSAERVGSEMMKILSLQNVAATLAQMVKVGILDISIKSLRALAAYEDLSSSPVAVARLAILFGDHDPAELQKAWRLSKATVTEAAELCAAADMTVQGNLNEVAYRHLRLGPVAICVGAAMAGWEDDRYREAIETFRAIDVPRFPITGNDLIESGFVQGPALGKALRRIERDWVKSGFEMDKDRLLHRLQVYLSMPL